MDYIQTLPPHLAAKLTPEMPQPKFKAWALASGGTPWAVYFPKSGAVPGKRRFFATPEEAVDEIISWSKGRNHSAPLGKRAIDEMTYVSSMLPPDVTLTDLLRFYLEHNPSSSKVSLKDVLDTVEADLLRNKASAAYRKTITYSANLMRKELGDTTPVVHLGKPKLIRFIKEAPEYWDRFNRRRIATLMCSKAVELGVIRISPLEGVKRLIGKEPKADVHALSVRDTRIILDYVSEHYPQFLGAFVLSLFAGIRTEELARDDKNSKRALRWSDFVWGQLIRVEPSVAKTGESREIRLWSAALENYLAQFRGRVGRVCEACDLGSIKSNIIEELNAARKAKGQRKVDFQKNDFRHSFASYAVAKQGVEKTMEDMGHGSFRMLKRYKARRTPEEAEDYFSSAPSKTDNKIIQLSA